MFRDDEIKYVVASVVLAWIIAVLVGYYEIFINRADSMPATAVAVMIGRCWRNGIYAAARWNLGGVFDVGPKDQRKTLG